MSKAFRFAAVGLAACASAVVLAAAAAECTGCLPAHYWRVPQLPDDAESVKNQRPPFPEDDYIAEDLRQVGLAFSGGGTRSASATLGQLRGLRQNGWLEHVGYISAVSGGAWASVPFTFTKRPLDDFLGKYETPDTLMKDAVEKIANGQLAYAIAHSSLLASGLPEGAAAGVELYASKHPSEVLTEVLGLANRLRREADRADKTYARLLAPIFVDGKKDQQLVEPGTNNATRLFSWNTTSADDMSGSGQLSDFVVSGPHRPFLIATGTLVSARADYDYPLLIPVEYTPLYVGVRTEFGGRFGGSYVWPWAYDPAGVGKVTPKERKPGEDARKPEEGTLEIKYDDAHRFTLADVVASTGAAPELAVVLGASLPEKYQSYAQKAADVFPAFRHVGVQKGGDALLSDLLPHADGGAQDNLGVLPLVARQVKNIIVFINTSTPFAENNDDLHSLFQAVGPAGLSGDKRHNAVFRQGLHQKVIDALVDARVHEDAQVFCDRDWDVLPNQRFGVRPYSGLNICFVYNAAVPRWERAFTPANQDVLQLAKKMKNFPWFATFEQNKPNVIKLETSQVNLLSNLTAWIMTNQDTVRVIRKAIAVFPCPPGMTCAP